MAIPQTGIFALGDAAHVYLEFNRRAGADALAFVKRIVDIHEPRTTVGGVNIVVGFRPEVWRLVAPHELPEELTGFNEPLIGSEDYVMPATQADLWLWIAGSSYDIAFDVARDAIAKLAAVAVLERELSGWSYRHSRDLTGFEDGTENPALVIAPSARARDDNGRRRHIGSEPGCLLQIIHCLLELAQSQLTMAAFQIKLGALRSEGQPLSGGRDGLAILPPRGFSF